MVGTLQVIKKDNHQRPTINHQNALRAQNSAPTLEVALEPKLEIVLNISGATAKKRAHIRAPTSADNRSGKPSARSPGNRELKFSLLP